MVDAYMRTGSKQYLNIYPLWWEGAPKFNFSGRAEDPWWNVFVDDMEWIALAQIRMFESTKDTKYLKKAKQMYDDWIWSTDVYKRQAYLHLYTSTTNVQLPLILENW